MGMVNQLRCLPKMLTGRDKLWSWMIFIIGIVGVVSTTNGSSYFDSWKLTRDRRVKSNSLHHHLSYVDAPFLVFPIFLVQVSANDDFMASTGEAPGFV